MNIQFAPVILAGGSGTRFWPRSRRARAKQVLALDGDRTMIQQTLDRLLPLSAMEDVWVITNELLKETISEQLPGVPDAHILSEPSARNTAPACALAAFLLEKRSPDAVIGIFPSDQVVGDVARFTEVVRAGVALAASGDRIVVLGVPPTRPETGFGYIEQGEVMDAASVPCDGIPVRRVKRFTEKPNRERAEEFLATGNYAWNGGIFLWSVRTLVGAIREFCPAMAPLLEKIAAAHGTSQFAEVFAELYPQCESISIDYAVLEPRSAKGELKSEIYCLPADFGWKDLGSWAALHEHQMDIPALTGCGGANVVEAGKSLALEAHRNYVFAPGKAVVLLGVDDLVVVETEDSLLITTRAHSQDVGRVVKALTEAGRHELI
ncbi:mannose-1-phosphate guanylyltransferase [Granulicella arctica]|uniref:Mannose-1-phosphate guanylyltransferase n=1 Tax=Granulicella arctica TaxID=940613 RepID=A0A7Y9THR3_9BACT|nr:mannose-1-phosphate guanylyltransferase [Granulicella arctica]NYF81356.1 mannose-1-phosphate guanylyltransferase [Granulicella arctica]